MSQISQKSISGITSITTPAGIDDVFTVHSGDTTERFRVDQSGNQNISGIVTATNFKTGSSNLHSTGLTVGDTFVHSTGVNGSSADIDDFVSVGNNIHLGNAGVVTATSFIGDGSDLTNLPAGLGTALSATASSPLNKMYYTNQVLGVPSSVTVDVPSSASKAYTQYADIKVDGSADLIIAEGDDLIPDVLGLADFGTFGGGASAGRIRVNSISNAANDGSPTVQKGLVVTGVTTSTTFSGSGASLTNLPAANLTGTLPAISGANLTSLPAQATIANNADNRVITGGSGVNLNGESTLTYGGTELLISNASPSVKLNDTDNSGVVDINNVGGVAVIQSTGDTLFETNSTERLRITSTGYVQTKSELWVGGSAPVLRWRDTTHGEKATARISGSDLYFEVNNAERLRITSGGQVCIGTNTAVRALTIKDPGQIHVESTSTGNWVGMSIKGSSGTNNYNAYFGILDSNGNFFIDNGSNGNDFIINQAGQITKPNHCCFEVKLNGDQSFNNNTRFKLNFNYVANQQGTTFDTSNNRFTAPVTGYYQFNVGVYSYYSTYMELDGRCNGASTGAKTYRPTTRNSSGSDRNPGASIMASWIVKLSANDYYEIFCYVSSGSGTRNIYSDLNRTPTWWSGFLVA